MFRRCLALRPLKGSSAMWKRVQTNQCLRFVRAFSDQPMPVIDLTGIQDCEETAKRAAKEIDTACREIGFLSITGHAVPQEAIDTMGAVSRAYFDRPAEEKKQITMTETYPYGYSGFAEETLAKGYGQESKPDLKECFAIGPSNPKALMPAVKFPAQPPGLAAAWTEYYAQMDALACRLLTLFAIALDMPKDFFTSKCDYHRSALRAINYPEQTSAPAPGQIRAGAHTDYGALTILRQDSVGGLEVQNRENEWCPVPASDDAFVINIGDLMQQWTNDVWVSTPHRVVNPATDKGNRRQSIAYFHNINHDQMVECIPTCQSADSPAKYPPILAWDHLMEKHLASTKH